MSIFYPHELLHRVTDISLEHLAALDIRALVLDIDNTLTTHDNPAPGQGVPEWLAAVQAAGIRCVLLSNNTPERVEPFARMLGLEYEANARKPFPDGVHRACRHMGVCEKQAAMVGDQIFTDVLAGRLAGVYTFLLEPIEPEKTRFFHLKRRLEAPIKAAFRRKKEHDK